jgi:hypothetical protein
MDFDRICLWVTIVACLALLVRLAWGLKQQL